MKKCKKFLAIFISVLTTTIIITGCGKDKPKRAENEIIIWETYNSIEHAVFRQIIANYQKTEDFQKSGLNIKVQRVPFSGLKERLTTAAASGDLPDICRVDTGDVPAFAKGNLALNLDPHGVQKHLEKLLPIASKQNLVSVKNNKGEIEKHIYAVTDQVTCLALFYNKDMFKKAGLSRAPRTINELISFGKKLTDTKKGTYGIALKNSLWWDLPWLYIHGADVFTPDFSQCTLNTSEAQKTFTFLRNLYAKHHIEAGAWKAGAINPDQGFINGKYAMILSGQWNLKTFGGVNFDVALIPGNNSVKTASNMGGTSMIVIKNTKYKEASYKLLEYLTSETAQKIWFEKTGQLSVNKKVNAVMKNKMDPQLKVFLEQMNYIRPRPRIPNYSECEVLVNDFFYAILDGKMQVKEALDKAVGKVNEQIMPHINE